MVTINLALLRTLTRGLRPDMRFLDALARGGDTLKQYDIDTPLRLAHFMAQVMAETGGFRYTEEDLSYSAKRLTEVWPSRFPTTADARAFANDPEALAESVYGKRQDLGNTQRGDGWRFRGRGFVQLTGRYNYEDLSDTIGVDLVSDPDLLAEDFSLSLAAACAYWASRRCNDAADADDLVAVSRGINLGSITASGTPVGLSEREHFFAMAREIWTDDPLTVPSVPLRPGDSGSPVRNLQRALQHLGYPVGMADGVYGVNTKGAVAAFQDEHDLDNTGDADDDTLDALRAALESDETRFPGRQDDTADDLADRGDSQMRSAKRVQRTSEVIGAGAAGGGAVASQVGGDGGETDAGSSVGEGPETNDGTLADTVPLPESFSAEDQDDAMQFLIIAGAALVFLLALFMWFQARSMKNARLAAHKSGAHINI